MKTILSFLCAFILFSAPALACDLCGCAVYNSPFVKTKLHPGFYFGAFEQYTYFGTMKNNGVVISNDLGQYMHSSFTQFVLSYRFSSDFALQVNVPYIVRAYLRPEGSPSVATTGSEYGVGDISVNGIARVLREASEDFAFALDVMGGVKFATGNADRIREELTELDPGPGIVPSGTHGHDLALGSGSTDVSLGLFASTSWDWFVATASLQYAIRSTGIIDYRYANDLNWKFSPGAYLWRNRESGLGALINLSGEYKGLDSLAGVPADDTGNTSIYLGGSFIFQWNSRLFAEIGADLPVLQNNTSIQLLPNVRAKASLTWRF